MDHHVKQTPVQGVTGLWGGSQGALMAGGAEDPVYIDDVFSTYLYKGNASSRSIVNGIDLSGQGGMTWIKDRGAAYNHSLQDTVRGAGKDKRLAPNLTSAQDGTDIDNYWAGYISSFNSNGFSIDKEGSGAIDWANYNKSGDKYSAWSFRKSAGFFDIVTYTGNGSSRTIAHSLGSIPGMIIIKNTSSADNWVVYHRTLKATHHVRLNQTNASASSMTMFNDTEPTASVFSVSTNSSVNTNGDDYVAYIFAGGGSTAATARSVNFDGTGDKLSIASHTDLQIGSSTYTMEFWVYKNADSPDDYDCWAAKGSNGNNTREFAIESMSDQTIDWYYATAGNNWSVVEDVSQGKIPTAQWTHICAQKDGSGYFSFFVNGTRTYHSTTGGATLNTGGDAFCIAGFADASTAFESNVKISNFRFIKGTALYSSSFKPSTEPLANVTNTKLLCCNDSSTTGSTVTPTTITAVGSPTASTDSPFDDPAAFTFGENEDQNLIKCGSYVGTTVEGLKVDIGWEPQWILFKNTATTNDWRMFDSMRGIVTSGNDERFNANDATAEVGTNNKLDITPTGFTCEESSPDLNGNGNTIIYMAIRRPDGYVGKPAEAGTDVFTIDLAGINAGDPSWVSNFPVDMQFIKDRTGTTYNFFNSTRLTQGTYLSLPGSSAQTSNSVYSHDYENGWGNYSSSDAEDITSWMWKRNSGFDVVTYTGTGDNSNSGPNATSQAIPHNLGKIPEMIWVKCRSTGYNWYVYHSGQNGGTNPQNYYLQLNATDGNIESVAPYTNAMWNNTAPTSTHFSLGPGNDINANNDTYIAYLFTSVSGISKCGYYDGSSSSQTITTGFQPRFVIIKCTTNAEDWYLLDTLRGWSSGNDNILRPNLTAAQYSNDLGAPTSTGFTLTVDNGSNASGRKYVYYAHA